MCPLCKAMNNAIRKNNTDPPGSHNPIFVNGYPSLCPNENKSYLQHGLGLQTVEIKFNKHKIKLKKNNL